MDELSALDWQPVNDPLPRPRARKESNTSASRYSEPLDAVEENTMTPDSLWYNTSQRSHVYFSDDDEASQVSWAEVGHKSNNLVLPEKTQVASRLHQIREYVNQTMSMMSSLREAGGQCNMAQHAKLASTLEGLRDSELKLQSFYEKMQRTSSIPSKGEAENFSEQLVEAPKERTNEPVMLLSKTSEASRRNELKKEVQLSQLKLQELQEQQAALKALRERAQEQLNEARAAQGALLQAQRINQQAVNADNMIQDRLHNLQQFFETRSQLVQMVGLEEEDSSEMQNKLDELQAKKQHMDQLLAQFSNLNNSDIPAAEVDRSIEDKTSELNAMRETLATLQGHTSPQLTFQDQEAKKETHGFMEKSNTMTDQNLQAKTHQLLEAKAKLQQLQTLLQTVEEYRNNGQPIPEQLLNLMSNSDQLSSPTHPHRYRSSSQELNISQPVSERFMNACERNEQGNAERRYRTVNSCEAEHEQQANSAKRKIQGRKLKANIQPEEFIRLQDMNIPLNLHNTSFNENGTTNGTWRGSAQETSVEIYDQEYSGELNETASGKNIASSAYPRNTWRKPSSGNESGISSHFNCASPYTPTEVNRAATHNAPLTSHPQSHSPRYSNASIPSQPDNHWIVHQITQLQNQLQQMSVLYKNSIEKQHNCLPPPWFNASSSLGQHYQYIAAASQWQLLVHSLNQCCQLMWHQQRELAALKDALSLLQQPSQQGHFSPPPAAVQSSSLHSNLSRLSPHTPLKTSLSAGPSLAPPAVVSSAHSLPNLTSPQATPVSPTSTNNCNLLSSPTATVLSLPPNINNTSTSQNPNLLFNPNSQFSEPNFLNLYPPYGNNLNYEFPSPVNFFPNPPESFLGWATPSQPQPATTLNNQVPPGIRANNYWDNFRSYSRQNLLSNTDKSNDGLLQRTAFERLLNTNQPSHPGEQSSHRIKKERLNAQSRQMGNNRAGSEPLTRVRVQAQAEPADDTSLGDVASGCDQQHQYNLCTDSRTHVRQQVPSANNVCGENEIRPARLMSETEAKTRLVNDCEVPRGANKKLSTSVPHALQYKLLESNKNAIEISARESKVSQLNNYPSETHANTGVHSMQPVNLIKTEPIVKSQINSRDTVNNIDNTQQNCIGENCLLGPEKGVRRKDCKANVAKDRKTEINDGGKELLEECMYSEVAALISVNEWRPQFLLQLFKDLRLLSSCSDPDMQAVLSSIHSLAARTMQGEQSGEHLENSQAGTAISGVENNSQQPRNWSHREGPQLPTNCAKLDWEVQSILLGMLPFIKSQLDKCCGLPLLEAVRKLILHLVPSQSTQEQLDAQLEDALHKFHGCKLGEVYEEMLIVVADVLISELTFLRLVNTVNHSAEPQQNVENAVEEEAEEEEGAVGGAEVLAPLSVFHPTNQPRNTKSETLSEADLAEADQSCHSIEERGDTVEDSNLVGQEDGEQDFSAACTTTMDTQSNTEACWAVEQEQCLGLDQIPTRLHNPANEEIVQDNLSHSLTNNNTNPDPGPL